MNSPRLSALSLLVFPCLSLAAIFANAADTPDNKPIVADIVLRGGQLHDGTGAAAKVGDVAIAGKKIVAVGMFTASPTARIIDCSGLIVAPGFIDLHSHSDDPITKPETRANVNFLTQGCTTVVTGNCGFGPVDVAAYFAKIDKVGAGTNVIHLLPHGSLRSEAMGKVDRRPTADEIATMKRLAEQAMRDGAFGMATGLIYVPGTYAETDELIEVSRTIAAQGGIYASHMRNEGARLLNSIDEILRIGEEAKIAVHVSHFKASGRDGWGLMRLAIEKIEAARAAGRRVTADQYPYAASSTSLEATLLPAWSREGGRAELAKRLTNDSDRKRIRAAVETSLERNPRIQVANCAKHPEWVGKRLDEIAAHVNQPLADLVLQIETEGGASVVNFGMREEDVREAAKLPWVATASDGSAKIPSREQPHPRSFGTFPRKIGRFAIQEKLLPVEQAIRSASGLPADILGLTDRGYLRPDFVADVVVLDPDTYLDHATFDNPYQYSTGVRFAFVNGEPAIYQGVPTGTLAGRAIRRDANAK